MRAEDLRHLLKRVKGPNGQGWYTALCPAHDDANPSFGFKNGEKKLVLECHAGCDHGDILRALGLSEDDLWLEPADPSKSMRPVRERPGQKGKAGWDPFRDGEERAVYKYRDAMGSVLFEVVRFEVRKGHPAYPDKTFRQRRYEGGRISWSVPRELQTLYNLPAVLRQAKAGRTVFVVEGEKDADTLKEWGFVATTNPCGAEGTWKPEYAEYLAGAFVILIPDNDAPGRRHVQRVAEAVYGRAREVRIVNLPGVREKGDVTDWKEAGGTEDELKALCRKARIWEPDDAAETAPQSEEGAEDTSPAMPPIGVIVADVEREHVSWLWPGYLARGKLTIIDGDPGLGKSTLYTDITARITRGQRMPLDNGPGMAPGRVVIVTCEDGIADTIRPRLEAAGADLARVRVIPTVPRLDSKTGNYEQAVPVLPDDLGTLETVVRQDEASLLIIDPIMSHLAGSIRSHNDQEVRRALAPLAAMAERTGAAVLAVRHLNKMTGGDPLYRGGGSIGFIGTSRIGLLLGRQPDDEEALVLAHTKNNLCRSTQSLALRVVSAPNNPEVGVIQWEGQSPLKATDLLNRQGGSGQGGALAEAEEWLREYLSDGNPHPFRSLLEHATAAGLAEKTVRRALKKLGAEKERIGGVADKGCWYRSLPDAKLPKMANPELGHLSKDSGHFGAETGVKTPKSGQFAKVAKSPANLANRHASEGLAKLAKQADFEGDGFRGPLPDIEQQADDDCCGFGPAELEVDCDAEGIGGQVSGIGVHRVADADVPDGQWEEE